ncbi:hypothetical protein HDV02_005165 [Globomyces sp. JEL0801]|nr:hypothetical protein HDV02_005165 [Globomyces sp. JEL0801]
MKVLYFIPGLLALPQSPGGGSNCVYDDGKTDISLCGMLLGSDSAFVQIDYSGKFYQQTSSEGCSSLTVCMTVNGFNPVCKSMGINVMTGVCFSQLNLVDPKNDRWEINLTVCQTDTDSCDENVVKPITLKV